MEGKKRKEVYGTLISRHSLHALDFCFPDVPERSSLLKAVDYLAKKWKAMEYCWPLNQNPGEPFVRKEKTRMKYIAPSDKYYKCYLKYVYKYEKANLRASQTLRLRTF